MTFFYEGSLSQQLISDETLPRYDSQSGCRLVAAGTNVLYERQYLDAFTVLCRVCKLQTTQVLGEDENFFIETTKVMIEQSEKCDRWQLRGDNSVGMVQ